MAHYVGSHDNRVRRTSGTLPAVSGDFTAAGWFYTAGTGSGYGYAFSILGSTGEGFYLDFGSGSWAMSVEDENGVQWFGASLGTLTASTWYHVALTKTSSALTGHRRALGTASYTSGTTPSTPDSIATVTSFSIGGDERYGSTSNYRLSRLFGWKIWQGVALTTAQLTAESLRVLPVYWSNIWGIYPLIDNRGIELRNNYTATLSGTTVQVGPPVPYGFFVPTLPYVVTGGTETSDNQAAYLKGGSAASGSVSAFLKGSTPAAGTANAFLKGSSASTGTASAFLEGAGIGAQDAASAFLQGKTAYALRPDGVVTQGEWTDQASGANLHLAIDEEVPNDSDYAWMEQAYVGSYMEVSLSNPPGTPGVGSWIIRWRAARIANTLTTTVKCELRQGAVVIASDEQTLTGSPQTFEYSLSAPEIANITDPDGLRLRFTITGLT